MESTDAVMTSSASGVETVDLAHSSELDSTLASFVEYYAQPPELCAMAQKPAGVSVEDFKLNTGGSKSIEKGVDLKTKEPYVCLRDKDKACLRVTLDEAVILHKQPIVARILKGFSEAPDAEARAEFQIGGIRVF